MSNQGLALTVVGWVATAPKEIVGGGVPYTSFRIATTPRRFDARLGAWADGRTEWITVKAFRDVAFNVAASVRKGDPLLVHGRLRTEEWESESGPRTTLVLEASALGHDLTRGTSRFGRTQRVGAADDEGAAPGASRTTGTSGASAAYEAGDPWAAPAPDDGLATPEGRSAEDGRRSRTRRTRRVPRRRRLAGWTTPPRHLEQTRRG